LVIAATDLMDIDYDANKSGQVDDLHGEGMESASEDDELEVEKWNKLMQQCKLVVCIYWRL